MNIKIVDCFVVDSNYIMSYHQRLNGMMRELIQYLQGQKIEYNIIMPFLEEQQKQVKKMKEELSLYKVQWSESISFKESYLVVLEQYNSILEVMIQETNNFVHSAEKGNTNVPKMNNARIQEEFDKFTLRGKIASEKYRIIKEEYEKEMLRFSKSE